jgi:hypothetical protein
MEDPPIFENVQQVTFGSNGSIGQLSLDIARRRVVLTVHQTGIDIYRKNYRFYIGSYSIDGYEHHGDCSSTDTRKNNTVNFLDLCQAIGANPNRVMNLAHKLVQAWLREHPPKPPIPSRKERRQQKLARKKEIRKRFKGIRMR